MATYYLDFENGNDSNNGSTWALAWKTPTSGPTAARIAPGDTIRVAKSPDPVSIGNVEWKVTSLYKFTRTGVLLAEVIDECESSTVWTAGSGSSKSESNTTLRVGTKSISFSGTSGAQKLAHRDLGTTKDYSAHQRLTFWFRPTQNLDMRSTSLLKFCLCSDTSGDTIVDEFVFPKTYYASGRWYPLTIDKGAACGSSIQSLAVYSLGSTASTTLSFDDICLTGAASSSSSLCLNDVIGKGSGGSEGWWAVTGIENSGSDTLITCRNFQPTDSIPTTTDSTISAWYRNFTQTTETVETFKRHVLPAFVLFPQTTGGAAPIIPNEAGGGPTTWNSLLGGWNTSTNERDGETWLDGLSGQTTGLSATTTGHGWKYDRFGFVRYNMAVGISQLSANVQVTNLSSVMLADRVASLEATSMGTYTNNSNGGTILHIKCANQIFGSGTTTAFLGGYWGASDPALMEEDIATSTAPKVQVDYSACNRNLVIVGVNSVPAAKIEIGTALDKQIGVTDSTVVVDIDQLSAGPTIVSSTHVVKLEEGGSAIINLKTKILVDTAVYARLIYISGSAGTCTLQPMAGYSPTVQFSSNSSNRVVWLTDSRPKESTKVLIRNMPLSGTFSDVLTTSSARVAQGIVVFENYNNQAGTHKRYDVWQPVSGDYSGSATDTDHNGTASQPILQIRSSSTTSFVQKAPIGRFAVKANKLVTLSAWVKKSVSGCKGGIGVYGGDVPGVASEVRTECTSTSWEQLSIQVTPTSAGVIELFMWSKYGTATGVVSVDDITITQAD